MFFLVLLTSLFNPDEKIKNPPGTIRIEDNLYVDPIEITNLDWAEYIHFSWLDSVKDSNDLTHSPIIALSPENQFLPKVNLRYQEALDYCKWRTDFINKRFYNKSKPGIRIKYRLPTESEIKKLVTYERESFQKRATKIRAKISDEEDFSRLLPTRKVVGGNRKLKRLKKNRIYGLFHSAAEMSSVEGVAYGMTNDTFNPSGDLMPKVVYSGPSPNVGFRCVAEFIYEQDQED